MERANKIISIFTVKSQLTWLYVFVREGCVCLLFLVWDSTRIYLSFFRKSKLSGGRNLNCQQTENLCGVWLETQPTKQPGFGLYFCICSIYLKVIICKHFWNGLLMKTWGLIGISEGLENSLHEVNFVSKACCCSICLCTVGKWAFKTPGESFNVEMWGKSVMQPRQGGMPKINLGLGGFYVLSFKLPNFPRYQSKLLQLR